MPRKGFPVAELTAEQWKESEARLKADEGAAANYLIDGRTPKAGEIFKNPRMAATLTRIAADGASVFYQGEIAEKIVRCSEKLGGLFTSRTLPIIARIGSNRSPPTIAASISMRCRQQLKDSWRWRC